MASEGFSAALQTAGQSSLLLLYFVFFGLECCVGLAELDILFTRHLDYLVIISKDSCGS